MKRAFSIFAMLMAAILLAPLAIGCQPTQPGPSSPASSLVTPKPATPSEGVSTPEPEYFVLDADTVAIGTVIQGSTPTGQGSSIYSIWDFNVEEYIIKPLSETTLKIRIWERDSGMPIKGVHLGQGEHLLVFLKNADDFFVFAGGMGDPGKFTVQDGRIQYSFYYGSPWQPLDEAISRIKAVTDTWAGENLTSERQAQVMNTALADPSVEEFLLNREHEVFDVHPYLVGFVPGEIRYLVVIQSPNQQRWEAHLVVIMNMTKNKVDKTILEVSSIGFTEADKDETLRIALADETVLKTIGDRGYEVFQTTRDYWQEVQDGKTIFHIFPMVELFLYPRGSENLEVFVDLSQKKVVKIFTESLLSPNPLESSEIYHDFTLTIRIPKTEYRVGETAEAIMTLSYAGDGPVELTSPGGEYFDILIKDRLNNFVYRWSNEKYPSAKKEPPGVTPAPLTPGPPPLPIVKETILPGWSTTNKLQFQVPQAGTLYLMGYTFHADGYQVGVSYPDGHGEGVNNNTPFLVVEAR